MSDYKKVTIYDKHDATPFMGELMQIDIDKRTKFIAGKNPSLVVNSSTGEVEGTQLFAIYEKVDKESFTKLYQKGMTEFCNLSKSGIKVFGYFTSIAKPNKGDVIFQMDECQKYTGYKTEKQVLKGISELLESGFIARSKYHYKYFINPTMFFNGSRVAFIKMYEVETNKNLLK